MALIEAIRNALRIYPKWNELFVPSKFTLSIGDFSPDGCPKCVSDYQYHEHRFGNISAFEDILLPEYAKLFQTLAIDEAGVEEYFEWERWWLACLHAEARRNIPSPTTLLDCRYKLAIDARNPLATPIARHRFEMIDGQYRYCDCLASQVAMPGQGGRPVYGVIANGLLFWGEPTIDTEGDLPSVVAWIENFLGMPPYKSIRKPVSRSKGKVKMVLSYMFDPGKPVWPTNIIRIWVNGKEVQGIGKKEVQRLLEYLWKNRKSTVSGRQLQEMEGMGNTSRAIKLLQNAITECGSIGESWVLPEAPYWHKDVTFTKVKKALPEVRDTR